MCKKEREREKQFKTESVSILMIFCYTIRCTRCLIGCLRCTQTSCWCSPTHRIVRCLRQRGPGQGRLPLPWSLLTLIRPGAIMPPPRIIFLIARNAYGWRPVARWLFSFESCATFKRFFFENRTYGYKVTWPFVFHVSPKIAHFRDLCTKHMEKSFFLKTDQTWVIGSCLKFRWLFWESK